MDFNSVEQERNILNDSEQTFVELLKERLLHVAKGKVVIRYWIDEKGSYFKFSEDSGVTMEDSHVFFSKIEELLSENKVRYQ